MADEEGFFHWDLGESKRLAVRRLLNGFDVVDLVAHSF
jgi:hypothetical protein